MAKKHSEEARKARTPASETPDPSAQHQPSNRFVKAWKWLRAKRWRSIGALLLAVLAPTVTGIGTSLWNGERHVVGQILDDPPAHKAARTPLGVTTVASYTDADAIALSKPVSTGAGYAEIVGGLTDIAGTGTTWSSFLGKNYGAPLSKLHTDITLTGQSSREVRVTNVQIQRVSPMSAPLSGTYIPIPHAGGKAAYRFSANMDTPNPVLRRLPSGQTFPDFNVQLSQGEQVTLSIDFLAARYSSKWTLRLTYLVGTHTSYLDIREPNNQPFAVTAPADSYKVTYISDYPSGQGYHLKRSVS